MVRKEESRTISIVEVGQQDGFEIRINYSVDKLGSKPESVNSSGTKTVAGVTETIQISTSLSGNNLQLPTGFDLSIAQSILTELKLILNKAVV